MHSITGLSPDLQGSDLVGTVTVRLGVGGQIGPRLGPEAGQLHHPLGRSRRGGIAGDPGNFRVLA